MTNSHVPYIRYLVSPPDILKCSHENLTSCTGDWLTGMSGKGNMGKNHFGAAAWRRKHSLLQNNLSFGRCYGLCTCVWIEVALYICSESIIANIGISEKYFRCTMRVFSLLMISGCCNLQRVKGLVYWPKYYQLEHWTHFRFLNSQGEAKGGETKVGWKKIRKQWWFFFCSFFSPLIRKQETRDGTWTNIHAGRPL